MRILITGACGFVGSTLAHAWVEPGAGHQLLRPRQSGTAGQRNESDASCAPRGDRCPWRCSARRAISNRCRRWTGWSMPRLIPACWQVSTAATSSRQLVEHNLLGTINMLEYCRAHRSGIHPAEHEPRLLDCRALASSPWTTSTARSRPRAHQQAPGSRQQAVSEAFSTEAPLSLYGTTKLASEQLALEYGAAFDFPVWINRCGVLAGGGQFGRPTRASSPTGFTVGRDAGPLAYIGFDGLGHQVRDCLHPARPGAAARSPDDDQRSGRECGSPTSPAAPRLRSR